MIRREPERPSGTVAATGARGPLWTVLKGLGWNSVGQVVGVLVNLGLTPFLLHRLGLAPYGVYALVSSFRGLLSNLDGGLGPCATRYFAVYAGARDRRGTSSLLVTMALMTFVVVGVVAGAGSLLAPQLTLVLHTSGALRHEATDLIRLFMPLLVASALRLLLTRIVTAEHRWAYLNTASMVGLVAYAAVAVVLVEQGRGLIGLFWASVAQEAVLLVASAVASRRYLEVRSLRLMPRHEVRPLVQYSMRVQIAEVASSFNFEIDALVVGLLLPVGDVGLYTIGSNFSTQLLNLPLNAVPPIAVTLSRTFGREGLTATIVEFTKLQRVWVRAIAPFALVGAVSAIVAIPRWLGPQARPAGYVAAILLLGQAVQLLARVMDALGKSANRPGLESRYLSIGMVVNLALTVPLALGIGMLGVPIGTAAGLLVSSLYFLRIARRDLSPDLRSFFSDVPRLPVLAAVGITGALEVLAYEVAPRGAFGLLACAVPAVLGLAVYAAWTVDRDQLRPFLPGARAAVRPGARETVATPLPVPEPGKPL